MTQVRAPASGRIRAAKLLDDRAKPWVVGWLTAQQIADQLRIGQSQKRPKRGFISLACALVVCIQKPRQQDIELAHAASALPAESRLLGPGVTAARVTQWRRSASIFFVSAIAFAGLRFFGQVLVQFMIV